MGVPSEKILMFHRNTLIHADGSGYFTYWPIGGIIFFVTNFNLQKEDDCSA